MSQPIGFVLALSLALAGSADAQSRAATEARRAAPECVQKLHRRETDLPLASKTARDRLIANPSRIDVVATTAAVAEPRRRAEIELGILRALEWLQCLDPSGYQAMTNYMRAHASDPVVADLMKAPNAQASAGGAPQGSANGSGNSSGGGAGLGASSPGFSAIADVVSPSH